MPGCSAVGCNNRSEKGYKMKCFPRDPKLRKIWQERVGRADWEPSNNSFLCDAHFEPDKWCITENGRVRLKKDAIPSIFPTTSTRKSAKKRNIMNVNSENCKLEYSMMYVENDVEHSSTDCSGEKHSVSQDFENSPMQFKHQATNNFAKALESKRLSPVRRNDPQQGTILISDDSVETTTVAKVCDVEKQTDEEEPVCDSVSNLASNTNEDLAKPEVKEEVEEVEEEEKEEKASVRPYNYDEIEEKLKQICDGSAEENKPNDTEKQSQPAVEAPKEETLQEKPDEAPAKATSEIPADENTNYKSPSKNNIGHALTNGMENIEIIFSAENGEEGTSVVKCESHNDADKDKIEKLDLPDANVDGISNDKEIEQSISVTPNIMAAMKRKRRTRDEIMKSIERSIRNASSQDTTNSVSDSDASDDAEAIENKRRKTTKMRGESSDEEEEEEEDTSPTTTMFTLKVTGHPDDVSDIMHNLSMSASDTNVQEYNDVNVPKEDDGLVTSVITIDDCPADVDDKGEFHDADFSERNIARRLGHELLPSTSRSSQYATLLSNFNEKANELESILNDAFPTSKSTARFPADDGALREECGKLQRKLNMQANTVKELSDQLIFCKRTGKKLQSRNLVLERRVQSLTCELNNLTNEMSPMRRMKEDVDSGQRPPNDLVSRLRYFEEANKKLVKAVAVGTEQVKKLENQLKHKDTRIKELNWKLEKASKYLERAEKNTNTYRRKMLNMQTFLRRKKLVDEKISKFNEILADIVKESYAGRSLPMSVAMDIISTCGASWYDRLLNCGFPLPSLSAVRVTYDNLSDSNESTNEILRAVYLRRNANETYNMKYLVNNVDIDSENLSESGVAEAAEDTEMVVRTVQDIFEEDNDDDDFSTSNLTEVNFYRQLNTFM